MRERFTAVPLPVQYDRGRVEAHFRKVERAIPWSSTVGVTNVLDSGDRRGVAADATAALRSAIAATEVGGVLEIPAGAYRVTDTVTIDRACTVVFQDGAYLIPDLPDGHATGRVIEITASGVRLERPRFDGSTVTGTPTANRYLMRVAGTALAPLDRVEIVGWRVDDCTVTDGSLLVTHAIYATYADHLLVSHGVLDTVSGAAIFLTHCTRPMVVFNRLNETGWYSIHYGNACLGGEIAFNRITGTGTGIRNFGASIDIMSQHVPLDDRNERLKVHHNEISGEHNYGACIRLLSVSYVDVECNYFTDCYEGTAGEVLSMVRIGARGDDTTHTHNGPCFDVRVVGNVGVAGGTKLIGVYADNGDYGAAGGIDYAEGLIIHDNRFWSVDASHYFQAAVTIHGQEGGIKGFSIRGNRGTFIPLASPVAGAIGLISGGASAPVVDGFIGGNHLTYLGTASSSAEIGLSFGQYVDRVLTEPNVLDGFYYNVRTGTNAGTDLRNLSEQIFRNAVSADESYTVQPSRTRMQVRSGTTANRPTPSMKGAFYFDTDVYQPLWWDVGTRWLNGAGQCPETRGFTDGDTTPSVADRSTTYVFANTGATSVTGFDDGVNQQRLTIRGDANTTLVHGSGLNLKGRVNYTFPNSTTIIQLVRISGAWYETARSED